MAQNEFERMRRQMAPTTPDLDPLQPGVASKRNYGTLDDVPAFFLSSFQQLERVTTRRFEKYHGVLYYGPCALDWPEHGAWGRPVKLASGEELQMRVWPRHALCDPENVGSGATPGTDQIDVAFLSTRVSHKPCQSTVTTAVLFRPGYAELGGEAELVDATNAMRKVACRGLHVLMAGLFKRHNPTLGPEELNHTGMVAYDGPNGCEALRASTYSIFARDRKDLDRTGDHKEAVGASAGISVYAIAYELLDMQIDDTGLRRVAEPMSKRRWKEQLTRVREDLTSTVGKREGEEALASAMAIVELLSVEGVLGLRANPFFHGALPERISGPHGPALGIVMGLRLAINWADYNLPRPSPADLYANDQMRAIWNTSGMRALPITEPNTWAIDLVVRAAIEAAKTDCDEWGRVNSLPPTTRFNILPDSMVFWARMGQAAITRAFGLGATLAPEVDSSSPTCSSQDAAGGRKPLMPWRYQDATQAARDLSLRKQGVEYEGVDKILVPLASLGSRKTALLRMVLDCETWIRTGKFKGVDILGPSAVMSPTPKGRVAAYTHLLSKIGLPTVAASTIATGKSFEAVTAVVLDKEIDNPAFQHACISAEIMLVEGPHLHLQQHTGTFVVAPSQCSPCSECEQPVHVLPGMMFKHHYSYCTACKAKRCIDCTTNFAKMMKEASLAAAKERKEGPYTVGRRCARCFAEPAQLMIKYVPNDGPRGLNTGDPDTHPHLLPRTSKRVPKPLSGSVPEQAGAAAGRGHCLSLIPPAAAVAASFASAPKATRTGSSKRRK